MQIRKMIPAFAIVTGLALALVTSGFKEGTKVNKVDTFTFEYNPPAGLNPYSITNVQDKSHWKETVTPPSCSGSLKACMLNVPDTYVDDSGDSPQLGSNFSITATESSSNVAYVSNTSAGSGSGVISNRNN
jgi:hypothetical protein